MSFKKKDRQSGCRSDCQLRVPRAKPGGVSVFSVAGAVKAAQLGEAIANGSKITQEPLDHISSA